MNIEVLQPEMTTRQGVAEMRADPHPEPAANSRSFSTILWMALFNLAALSLTVVTFVHGWAQPIFATDATGLTYVIAGVFVFGLALSFWKGWIISCEMASIGGEGGRADDFIAGYLVNVRGRSAGSRAITAATLRVFASSRIASVQHFAGSLVLLGLIGTVLGFIIALSGVSAESATNLADTSAMVSRLIEGMSIALYTTLEGAVLNLWLGVNYRMLVASSARLVNRLVALGESHARS